MNDAKRIESIGNKAMKAAEGSEENETVLEARDLNRQGLALCMSGNIEAAKDKFEKAIETEPMLMDSYKNFGDLYLALEQYQEATINEQI